jgi:hypothetical protein
MALQTTGAITLAQIQTGFGGVNPIGMNEYYRGGVNVPNVGTLNPNIPTSGAISMQNFYGAKVRTTNTFDIVSGSRNDSASFKGYSEDYYYYGYHTTSNQLYRPFSNDVRPSEGSMGSNNMASTAIVTHNGSYFYRSLYSAVRTATNSNTMQVYYVLAIRNSISSYLPDNDATFTSLTIPISISGNPQVFTVARSGRSNFSQYVAGGFYHSRWVWGPYTADKSALSFYLVRTGTASIIIFQ